jgi:23S rRNA (adenine2503-C2)-methyltransferase
MSQKIVLKNFSYNNLRGLEALNTLEDRYLRQLQVQALQKGCKELPDQVDQFSRKLWQELKSRCSVPHLECTNTQESPIDGFKKYVFQTPGKPGLFETVRIPLMHRPGDEKYIVCVSSQVGCAAGCVFCATGRMGFKRNLETWEIVDQIVKVKEDSSFPVRGVVFMGMGEPFLNYANVIQAGKVISESCGLAIDSKAVTYSTVGVVPMIKRFTHEAHPQRLIVSLTSAIDAKRDKLLPMNLNYPIASIIDALREYQALKKRRVSLAWTMISSVNMDREEAKALALATKGLRILVDLIPVNDATGRFKPPTETEYQEFLNILNEEVKCPVVRRYSGGKDVRAACGMLSTDSAESLETN